MMRQRCDIVQSHVLRESKGLLSQCSRYWGMQLKPEWEFASLQSGQWGNPRGGLIERVLKHKEPAPLDAKGPLHGRFGRG